jgi:hypothetical protein
VERFRFIADNADQSMALLLPVSTSAALPNMA